MARGNFVNHPKGETNPRWKGGQIANSKRWYEKHVGLETEEARSKRLEKLRVSFSKENNPGGMVVKRQIQMVT